MEVCLFPVHTTPSDPTMAAPGPQTENEKLDLRIVGRVEADVDSSPSILRAARGIKLLRFER